MLTLNFHPFPEINTTRLLLRRLERDDANEIFFLRSDPSVLRFLNKDPCESLKEAAEFIKTVNANMDDNDAVMWGLELKEQPSKIIGTACFWNVKKEDYRAELGYVLHPAHWRKGLMKETLQAVIEYGFLKMGLHSIEAHVDPANENSTALLESLGFSKEALLHENVFFGEKFGDTAIYSLLNFYFK